MKLLLNMSSISLPVKRVILVTDAGVDDFLAILILLHGERLGLLKIEAIICTAGNTTLENVVINVSRLLELAEKKSIPVYKGSKSSLLPPAENIKPYHGRDGFGDLKHEKETDVSFVRETPGCIAMYEIVSKYPGEVSVMCIAPLTDVALTLKIFDDFGTTIKDLWIMGGNYQGLGNITSCAEFNFYHDPEAAHITLETVSCPTYIFPWEPCLLPNIPLAWRYKELAKSVNPGCKLNQGIWDLLTAAEKVVYAEEKDWLPCDAFLAAAYVFPEKCITKTLESSVTVELHGRHTRGQMIRTNRGSGKHNVTIIEEIDADFFKDLSKNIISSELKSVARI